MAGLRVDDYRVGRIDNPHYNPTPLGVNMSADCGGGNSNGITSNSASVPSGYLKERQDDNKSCYSNTSSPHTPDDLSSSNKVCNHFMFTCILLLGRALVQRSTLGYFKYRCMTAKMKEMK